MMVLNTIGWLGPDTKGGNSGRNRIVRLHTLAALLMSVWLWFYSPGLTSMLRLTLGCTRGMGYIDSK